MAAGLFYTMKSTPAPLPSEKSIKSRLQHILAAFVMGGTLASGCKPSLCEDEDGVTQPRRLKKLP